MNYRALCFVDMPFGKKPDLKAAWSLILIKFTPRRSNRAIGVRGFVIDQSAMSRLLSIICYVIQARKASSAETPLGGL